MGKTRNLVSTWPLRNDQIVLRVLATGSLKDVAKEFSLTAQQISVICNDPRGEEIIRAARERLREKLLEGIEDQLDVAAQASLKVLQRTLKADISPMHKAKPNQDRVALKILGGRGFLHGDPQGDGGGTQLSEEQFSRLVSAMKASDAVRGIDPFEKVEVQEAEIVSEEVLDERIG